LKNNEKEELFFTLSRWWMRGVQRDGVMRWDNELEIRMLMCDRLGTF
jgi:hypothetical protein